MCGHFWNVKCSQYELSCVKHMQTQAIGYSAWMGKLLYNYVYIVIKRRWKVHLGTYLGTTNGPGQQVILCIHICSPLCNSPYICICICKPPDDHVIVRYAAKDKSGTLSSCPCWVRYIDAIPRIDSRYVSLCLLKENYAALATSYSSMGKMFS